MNNNGGIANLSLWLPLLIDAHPNFKPVFKKIVSSATDRPDFASIELNGASIHFASFPIMADMQKPDEESTTTNQRPQGMLIKLIVELPGGKDNLEMQWFTPPDAILRSNIYSYEYQDFFNPYMMRLQGAERNFMKWLTHTKLIA